MLTKVKVFNVLGKQPNFNTFGVFSVTKGAREHLFRAALYTYNKVRARGKEQKLFCMRKKKIFCMRERRFSQEIVPN